jgi:hypothetical protein
VLGIVAALYQTSEKDRADEARDQADQRALNERRLALYAQLLSSRETSDTEVRRGIFDKVLEKYLQPGSKDIEQKIVALELMSANFHDSLNLSPLFWQLDKLASANQNPARRGALLDDLARIAKDVKERQVETLSISGAQYSFTTQLGELKQNKIIPPHDFELQFVDPSGIRHKHKFSLGVVYADNTNRRVRIQYALDESLTDRHLVWADLYDFPQVTFTRLSSDERVAVVLLDLEPTTGTATVVLVYYPSSRGGVKDKPFIDEVIENLRSLDKSPSAKRGRVDSFKDLAR